MVGWGCWGVRKRKRRSSEARRLVRDQLGIGSVASSVRCEWSLGIVWGFPYTWLLLAEPTKHGGMCGRGWGHAAIFSLAQLAFLNSYNPLTMLIMFSLQSLSGGFHVCSFCGHWLHGRIRECSKQMHLYTAHIHFSYTYRLFFYKIGCIEWYISFFTRLNGENSITKWTESGIKGSLVIQRHSFDRLKTAFYCCWYDKKPLCLLILELTFWNFDIHEVYESKVHMLQLVEKEK